MGAAPSSPRENSAAPPLVSAENLIGEFVGEESFPLESDYWQKLLELPLDLHWPSVRVRQACEVFAQNNYCTRHLAKILIHLAWCLQECASTQDVPQSAYVKAINATYITSVLLKYLVENAKSNVFEKLCLSLDESEKVPNNYLLDQSIESFVIRSIFSFIGKVDVSPDTYLLHHELLHFMLVAMSTQLLVGPSPGPKDIHPFTDAAMIQESSLVGLVVHKLLLNYIMRPHFDLNNASHEMSSQEYESSVLQRLASFVLSPFNYFVSSSGEDGNPLADRSLEVLLILIHYRKCLLEDKMKDSSEDSATTDFLLKENTSFADNPYCKALQNARDMQFDDVDIVGKAPSGQPVRLPFASLFDTLSTYLADETSVLLLYTLVQGNSNFLEYVLVRADIDTLLMPLLETLYNAPKRASNQIYLVLIVLLILSQDSSFNASVHKLILASVPWYQEQRLHQISLGSLMFIILIRTVKYNLSKMQDVYLHTNCLATLANMAPHVHHLSAYASQRLVSLFDMLARKYNKLPELKNHINVGNGKSREENLPEDLSTEMHIYTDFLRLVLEIINAILTYTLPRNPEVVYAILHRQEVFLPFKNHPRFNELLDNIYTVLDFFNSRMDAQRMEGEWSVVKVLEVIIINCRYWRGEGLMMFNQLRFTYEQESHPEEFFIPYVWQLAISHWGFSFNPSGIKLFSVDLPVKDNFASEDNEHQNGQQNEHAVEADLPVSQNPIRE